MIVFFAERVEQDLAFFNADEAAHCIKVLRHKKGDTLPFIDGRGFFYRGEIVDIFKDGFSAKVVDKEEVPGLPYRLHMVVAPTKSPDRYEWFIEKVVETGVTTITPLFVKNSERKIFKPDRARKIILSSAKQSLKPFIPVIEEATSLSEFLKGVSGSNALKMIGYCEPEDKSTITDLLRQRFPAGGFTGSRFAAASCGEADGDVVPEIYILIGPEGDFTAQEVLMAKEAGFRVMNLGPSRFRTETAAVVSAAAVYYHFSL